MQQRTDIGRWQYLGSAKNIVESCGTPRTASKYKCLKCGNDNIIKTNASIRRRKTVPMDCKVCGNRRHD